MRTCMPRWACCTAWRANLSAPGRPSGLRLPCGPRCETFFATTPASARLVLLIYPVTKCSKRSSLPAIHVMRIVDIPLLCVGKPLNGSTAVKAHLMCGPYNLVLCSKQRFIC